MHVSSQWPCEHPTCANFGNREVYESNKVPVYSSGVMEWCGITKEKVIGSYLKEGGTGTADLYKYMLSRKVFPASTRLEQEYVFQQYDPEPHRTSSVRAYLNRKCSICWIGRQSPIDWPARSPQLSSCDFFLWICIKGKPWKN